MGSLRIEKLRLLGGKGIDVGLVLWAPGIQTCLDVVGRIRKVISQSKVGETKKTKMFFNKSMSFCLIEAWVLGGDEWEIRWEKGHFESTDWAECLSDTDWEMTLLKVFEQEMEASRMVLQTTALLRIQDSRKAEWLVRKGSCVWNW